MDLLPLIEKARALGDRYPWQDELDNAESFYYKITAFG